jgi:hypothetical protein
MNSPRGTRSTTAASRSDRFTVTLMPTLQIRASSSPIVAYP